MNKKKDIIAAMRKKGMTFEEIGSVLGVTRQAVHQALNRENNSPRFREEVVAKVKYAGLRNWLIENRVSLSELERRCSATNLHHTLIGDGDPRKASIFTILGVTGMTYEECFACDGG